MTAIEFINKGIKFGDKVELTLPTGQTVTGFFSGYKTYGLIEPCLDNITPVFYASKKDGTMGKRSAFGKNHCTNIPYSSIKDIKTI